MVLLLEDVRVMVEVVIWSGGRQLTRVAQGHVAADRKWAATRG